MLRHAKYTNLKLAVKISLLYVYLLLRQAWRVVVAVEVLHAVEATVEGAAVVVPWLSRCCCSRQLIVVVAGTFAVVVVCSWFAVVVVSLCVLEDVVVASGGIGGAVEAGTVVVGSSPAEVVPLAVVVAPRQFLGRSVVIDCYTTSNPLSQLLPQMKLLSTMIRTMSPLSDTCSALSSHC